MAYYAIVSWIYRLREQRAIPQLPRNSDTAVQLRRQSRGETSGSVFDVLAHGLPLITNGHGAMAELRRIVC